MGEVEGYDIPPADVPEAMAVLEVKAEEEAAVVLLARESYEADARIPGDCIPAPAPILLLFGLEPPSIVFGRVGLEPLASGTAELDLRFLNTGCRVDADVVVVVVVVLLCDDDDGSAGEDEA